MENEKFKTILNSVSDGVITVDKDLRIDYLNRAAREILQVEDASALGAKCFEVFKNESCGENCPLKKAVRDGKSSVNKPLCASSGKKRAPISVSASPIYDSDGNIVGGVQTFRDLNRAEIVSDELRERYVFENIVGKSRPMRDLKDMIRLVGETESTVLIEGESGTGKELIARALHNVSKRNNMPFVAVNCAALPDSLLESELFGYVAGAFTDAKKDKKGRFALAEGGTLFLDEIGEISQTVQVKLLRALQERRYQPLGGVEPVKANVRVVAATNKNLEKMVAENKFREDFYYRINVVKVVSPPLRKRKEDLPLLVDHFVRKFNDVYDRRVEMVSPLAMNVLAQYDFPGNVRELENFIERAFALCREPVIKPECLPDFIRKSAPAPAVEIASNMRELEAVFLVAQLQKNGWNRKKTAEDLGVNPSTLYRKFKKLGIKPPKK